MNNNLVGEWFGKYFLETELGRGGMAVVYKANHPHLNRPVAVKILMRNLDEENLQRFKREGTMIANLRHPNIVQVFDFDFEGDIPYMVMEYLEGDTLKNWLATDDIAKPWRIIPLPEAIETFLILAEALEHAHSRGTVHRDIKPANVLFTADHQPVLTDFGIAYILGSTHNTPADAIIGTPAYMCPEQFSDRPIDIRSDVYSMGVLLFQMLTGHMPFEDPTPIGTIYKLIHQPAPPPSQFNPEIPFSIEQIILHAMEKDPEDRYQTISEMARAVRRATSDQFDDIKVINDRPLADIAIPKKDVAPVQIPWHDLFFVGREAELEQARQIFEVDDAPSILCISGMGGVGKTSFASHLAHSYRKANPGMGILWADFTKNNTGEILDNWGEALEGYLDLHPTVHEKSAAFQVLLGTRQMLLVIENAISTEEVIPLLPGRSNCKVLLTTRNIDLPAALNIPEIRLQSFSSTEALQLGAKILGEKRIQPELEQITKLFGLVENLPLAVKILTGRLSSRKHLRASDLLEHLLNEKSRLEQLQLSDLAVRTSFQVSWHTLPPPLKHTYSFLAVFQGRTFTLEALAAITGLTPKTASQQLESFISLSLLQEQTHKRFRQHLLLADFAQEHLEDETLAFQKMAEYYLNFAQTHRAQFAQLEEEWDHLLAGMKTMHALRQWSTVLAYGEVIVEFWFAQGRFSAAREGLRLISEAAESLGETRKLADSLCRWGEACVEQNDYEEGEEILKRSLELYRTLYDHIGAGRALYFLGYIAVERSEFEKAEWMLRESRDIHLQAGDKRGQALCLGRLAYIPYYRDDYQGTKDMLARALQLFQQGRDPRGTIRALSILSACEFQLGNLETALGFAQRAMQLCNEFQEQAERSTVLEKLSDVYRRLGNLENARLFAMQSLNLLQQFGDRKSQAKLYYALSKIEESAENHTAALQNGTESLQILEEIGDNWGAIFVLFQIGNLHEQMDNRSPARKAWKQGLKLANQFQSHPLKTTLAKLLE